MELKIKKMRFASLISTIFMVSISACIHSRRQNESVIIAPTTADKLPRAVEIKYDINVAFPKCGILSCADYNQQTERKISCENADYVVKVNNASSRIGPTVYWVMGSTLVLQLHGMSSGEFNTIKVFKVMAGQEISSYKTIRPSRK